MAMEGKMNCIKYLMFFFNLLFWLSGLALIIVGAIVKSKYGEYLTFADNKYADAAIFLIIVGVIVFIVAFLGCCGAIKEHYCMVTTFAVLLSIIFILEVAAGALGFAYRKKVESVADKALKKAKANYDSQAGSKDFFDWVQKHLKCCGINGSSDWSARKAGNGTSIPQSCCKADKSDTMCAKNSSNVYSEGCKQKFEDFVKNKLVVIGAVALAIAFIQILGVIFAALMAREIRGQYEVV